MNFSKFFMHRWQNISLTETAKKDFFRMKRKIFREDAVHIKEFLVILQRCMTLVSAKQTATPTKFTAVKVVHSQTEQTYTLDGVKSTKSGMGSR